MIDKSMIYARSPLVAAGVPYTLVFQCRVRPKRYTKPERRSWLIQSPEDIRPCGILLKRCPLADGQAIRYIDKKNPYRAGTPDWTFYSQKLVRARTVREAKALGRS